MEHREGISKPDPLDCSILVLYERNRSQLMDSSQVHMYIHIYIYIYIYKHEP